MGAVSAVGAAWHGLHVSKCLAAGWHSRAGRDLPGHSMAAAHGPAGSCHAAHYSGTVVNLRKASA